MIFSAPDQDPGGRPPLTRLLGLVSPVFYAHRGRLAIGFIALLIVDGLQLSIPRFIKLGVDQLASGHAEMQVLLLLALGVLGAALAMAVFRFCWRYLLIGFSRILEQRLRDRIYGHVLTMDQAFFNRWTTGDLMAHSSNDLAAIQLACGMGMVAAVDAFVISIAAILFMAAIDARLTLLALLPMPFLALSTRILSGKMHRRFLRVQELFSRLTEFSRTNIASIRLLKAYTLEPYQQKEFDVLGRAYLRANLRVASIQGLLFPAATMAGSLGMLMVLYFGGRLVITRAITLGDFVAFITYLYMLIWPMMAVGWVTNLAQRGLTSLGRINTLLRERPLVRSPAWEKVEPVKDPVIEMQDLCFAYPSMDENVLRHIQLKIGPGVLGITGPTGSGKSTLCRLLLRMYPVENGQLFFSGIDINRVDVARVRASIAYVSQEPVLFSSTIADNIAMGRPDARPEAIEQAAVHAGIDREIRNLPDGYRTLIGERGVKLSGGQKQRVALARALLSARPVLVIDDGLSALDVETEQQVFAAIRASSGAGIIVVISHRVNILRHADRIVIVEQGRIAAAGGHEDLLETPFYRTMLEKQRIHA